jgi:uncharacterized protein
MRNPIHVSDNLSFPLDCVTQTFAILGIRGSGKTNTAVVMMEEMLKHGQQCVAIDPTNAWYGIRSSRDGKSAGFKVYVFGGPNGDLPLEGTHGTIMADFVVETGASVVFSLRHLSMNDQRRFAMEFGERLHHLKGKPENRTPLCLYLDEADEVVPQRIPKGHERMFGAYDRLVRRDRNCGLGVVLISQRPQVINKDTLSQIETLICHRLLHKLDRKSVKEAWVEGHDIKGKADEFFGALASLGKGDTWVWSPEWLDIFKRVHIRERETFDSSATPKAGERPRIAHKLAEVDLDKLKERLSETIQKAKEDDPRTLRAEIARLQKEIRAGAVASGKQSASVSVPASAKERVVEKIVKVLDQDALRSAIASRDEDWLQHISAFRKRMTETLDKLVFVAPKPPKYAKTHKLPPDPVYMHKSYGFDITVDRKTGTGSISGPSVRDIPAYKPEPSSMSASASVSSNGNAKLPPGERAILIAAVQFNGVKKPQLATLTGYAKRSRDAYIQRLGARGYITVSGNIVSPTDAGISALGGDYAPLPVGDDLWQYWRSNLPEGELKLLTELMSAGPGAQVNKDRLMEVSGYARRSVDAYLQRLRAKRLVETSQGSAAACEDLFD